MSIKNFMLITCMLILFQYGCGDNIFSDLSDDTTEEAKEESAKMSLDSGDYDSAIETLEVLCGEDIDNLTCDEDTRSLYASALMGKAGIDIIEIMDVADSTEADAAFNMIEGIIKPENIDNLQNAIDVLNSIPDENRTTEQELQLAVAAASHMVASIITTAAPDFDSENPETAVYNPENVDQTLVDTIIADLSIVSGSSAEVANEITEGEIDLVSEIEGFKADIKGPGGNTDENPTLAEIQNYINNLN